MMLTSRDQILSFSMADRQLLTFNTEETIHMVGGFESSKIDSRRGPSIQHSDGPKHFFHTETLCLRVCPVYMRRWNLFSKFQAKSTYALNRSGTNVSVKELSWYNGCGCVTKDWIIIQPTNQVLLV